MMTGPYVGIDLHPGVVTRRARPVAQVLIGEPQGFDPKEFLTLGIENNRRSGVALTAIRVEAMQPISRSHIVTSPALIFQLVRIRSLS